MTRPTLQLGSEGVHVETVQECLDIAVDGDFGPDTLTAVLHYQGENGLEPDGIVGPQTWTVLESEFDLEPWPTPLPPPLDVSMQAQIIRRADASQIGIYSWKDRGVAPEGYTRGMAMAYGTVVRKWLLEDSSALDMARANTGEPDIDALAWYEGVFRGVGMYNNYDGIDTLRHLFVLLMGLGMRESSGQHCCGRDQSADNFDSMTCEAGLFQMSWNMESSSDEMQKLFDQFVDATSAQTNIEWFQQGVTCSADDWESYGSGAGFQYQQMAKVMPQFAVETAAVGLRWRRQHWGPINRLEAEVRVEADELFRQVEAIVVGDVA